jgi:hypothetical protein
MPDSELSLEAVLADVARTLDALETAVRRMEQLTDHVRVLANNTLKLHHSHEKSTEATLLLRQKVSEIYDQREFIRAGLDEVLRKLAVVSKDVDDVDKGVQDAKGAARDAAGAAERAAQATGAHPLVTKAELEAEKRSGTLKEALGAFRELPLGWKLVITIGGFIALTHAEIGQLVEWLLGR